MFFKKKVHTETSNFAMTRRNAMKRNRNLDEEQTQEAMKVLERYCRKKYRNSVMISQNDLDTQTAEAFTPMSRPISGFQFPRQTTFDRQSTIFSFHPGFESKPALSPAGLTFDFNEPSVKAEIKFDSRKETLWKYISRVSKFFYHYFGLKHLFFVLLLVSYALAGGFVFKFIEEPYQTKEAQQKHQVDQIRHQDYADKVIEHLYNSSCLERLLNETDMTIQLLNNNSLCSVELAKLFADYDKRLKKDGNESEGWEWDYWNSVFYAGTVFTTIGYGNLACKTSLGRMITIIYALIGIPMMLVIMNIMGQALFRRVRKFWRMVKGLVKDQYKRKIVVFARNKSLQRAATIESVSSADVADYNKSQQDIQPEPAAPEENDLFETFPMILAIIIVFIFIVISSCIFSIWEDWDLFTAFYFTFISLSTVGFGDVIPAHPKYACILFIFYFFGLGLVSMCLAIIQARVEHKYMWALQLIDQEHEELLEQVNEEKEKDEDKTADSRNDVSSNIRWRGDQSPEGSLSSSSKDLSPDLFRRRSKDLSPDLFRRRQSTMMLSTPGDVPLPTPPVLSVFFQKAMSTRRKSSLARSDSVLSKSSINSKLRPFTNSPSSNELLTPDARRSPRMSTTDGPCSSGGAASGKHSGSCASLAPRAATSVPLSVITEVSDEDTIQSRRNTRKDLPRMYLTEDLTDNSASMHSSTDSEVSNRTRNPKLRRAAAQDLEIPVFEMAPLSPKLQKPTSLNLTCINKPADS